MRVLWLLTTSILCSLSTFAGADTAEDLRALVQETPIKVQWQDYKKQPIPTPEVKYLGPGQWVIRRQNSEHQMIDYSFKLTGVISINPTIHLAVKSTSCPNVPETLNCKIVSRFTGFSVELRSNTATQAEFQDTIEVSSDLSPDFAKKYFPDMERYSNTYLKCDDWRWAVHPTTHNIEVLEIGNVESTTVSDLDLPVNNNKHVLDSQSCNPRVGCALRTPERTDSYISLLFGDNSWYVDLQRDADHACTIEFQSLDTAQAYAKYAIPGVKFPLINKAMNTPNALKQMQKRFTEEMLNDWVKARIKKAIGIRESTDTSTPFFSDIFPVVKFPWLYFLNVIGSDAVRSVDGTEGYTISDRLGKPPGDN